MLSLKELLEFRKQIKNKKPDFIRQDAHKMKRLAKKWRNPKGLHSKIRLKLKGRSKYVSVGYRGPKKVRYLHKSGLKQQLVRSLKDLESLDDKKVCIIISSTLGERKKIVLLKKAKVQGFTIVNIKDPEEYTKKVEEKMNLKKKVKKEKEQKAKDAKKGDKDVKKEKGEKKLTEKVSEEQKKGIEKKEKDRFLTKRG